MFTKAINTIIATTFIATAFSVGYANAGGGGGGGGGLSGNDPSIASATLHNPDGSSITAQGRKGKDGYYVIKRNKFGNVTSKRLVQKKKKAKKVRKPKQEPFVTVHNPDGSSRTITNVRGQRVIITHDANGNQTSWTRVR